jgi:hypothetical protein
MAATARVALSIIHIGRMAAVAAGNCMQKICVSHQIVVVIMNSML